MLLQRDIEAALFLAGLLHALWLCFVQCRRHNSHSLWVTDSGVIIVVAVVNMALVDVVLLVVHILLLVFVLIWILRVLVALVASILEFDLAIIRSKS